MDLSLFKSEFINIGKSTLRVLPTVFLGIIVFSLLFFVATPLTSLLMRPVNLVVDSKVLNLVVRRTLITFFCLFGLYLFLRIAGLTQIAVAIISGTGIVGLIIGFAFKDIAENYIASLLISARRPFQIKDIIEVDGYIGVVQKVTLRGTTIVDFDGNHVQIPNSVIYKGTIKNLTANPNMRGTFLIGIGYDADIALAQNAALDILKSHKAILDEPQPQVLVDSLGSSTINLKIYFWINAHHYALNKVSSDAMYLIVNQFLHSNISMPDNAREVIFPKGIKIALSHETMHQTDDASQKIGSVDRKTNVDLKSDFKSVAQQASESRIPDESDSII